MSENLTIAPLQHFSCCKKAKLDILSGNEILTYIKGHNSATNNKKKTGNNPNPDLVNINAHTKFGEVLSICFKDIERKGNLTYIKGNNSATNTNLQKMTGNNPNLDLVNISIYISISIHRDIVNQLSR